jgi:hypothetical protein
MKAMWDVHCEKCGKKFGYAGKFSDQPPCPKCGHQKPKDKLEGIQKILDEDERIIESSIKDIQAFHRRRKRTLAGLTARQAARLSGIDIPRLDKYESGQEELTEEETKKLDALYSGIKLEEK